MLSRPEGLLAIGKVYDMKLMAVGLCIKWRPMFCSKLFI